MDQQVQEAPQVMAVAVAVAHMAVCMSSMSIIATISVPQDLVIVLFQVPQVILEAQETQYQTLTRVLAMVVRVDLEALEIQGTEDLEVKEDKVLQEQQVIQAPQDQRLIIVASH